ncbi:Co2+/Mg2+ efflux protein ApaG [Flavobacteriaceae bacterium]|nr:Co2+/Mg2+ efflux protein ApaG [Flavobacteriaceae bacterium]
MNSSITKGIKITAHPRYLGIQEEEESNFHVFTYKIEISNSSPHRVRLLKRHWHIFDSLMPQQNVNGDGVIGKKPIIEPGRKFTYESFCLIEGDYGQMQGSYTIYNLDLNESYRVEIPKFELISTSILN